MEWEEILITVESIVDPDYFTEELKRRLQRVRVLVQLFGGEPTSRQIAAVVIEAWERDGKP